MPKATRIRSRSLFGGILQVYAILSTTLFIIFLYRESSMHNSVFFASKQENNRVDIKFYAPGYQGNGNGISHIQQETFKDNITNANRPFKQNMLTGKLTEKDDLEDGENENETDDYRDDIQDALADDIIEMANDQGHISLQNKTHKTKSRKWIHRVKGQNKLYDDAVVKQARDMRVFYISAIASTTTGSGQPDVVTLNGWQQKKHFETTLYCCFKQGSKTAMNKMADKRIWNIPEQVRVVTATQFICNISPEISFTEDSISVQIALSKSSKCQKVKYISVERSLKSSVKDSIGFCSKVIYGEYPAERVIEWFEMNREMGVDHVVMFTYNVTKQMNTVLKHYEESGYLTLKPFDFPMKFRYPRHLGQKYVMAWVDEQVTVFDCLQRFSSYKYIGVVDVDEFIVPKGYKDYRKLLGALGKKNPLAAGFTFHTVLFILDWGETDPEAKFTISKYRQRTQSMWDRKKNIFMPRRVDPGSVWTHSFEGCDSFVRMNVPVDYAVIFHYRRCRPHWIKFNTCHQKRKRFSDDTMLKFLPRIEQKIEEKRQMLLN